MEEKSWTNPGFQMDENEPRSSPRKDIYQLPRSSRPRSHPDQSILEEINYNGIPRPSLGSPYNDMRMDTLPYTKKKDHMLNLPEDDYDEDSDSKDYSLLSFFSHLSCYKYIAKKYNNSNNFCDMGKLWNKIKLTFAILACFAYLLVFTLTYSTIDTDDHWCRGHGFLAIIVCFALILLLYFKIFKPLLGKRIYKYYKSKTRNSKVLIGINTIMEKWYVKLAIYLIIIALVVGFLVVDSAGDRSRLVSLLGIFVLIGFGFLFSVAPRKVIWRQVLWGVGLQFVMGLLILRWSVGRAVFQCLGDKVHVFLQFTDRGTEFVYGQIVSEWGVFAFKILSVILFFSFCIQILYYYGIMQWIVIKVGWLLQVFVGTTACESVNAAANVFLGMSEAPLLIKPFLSKMTKSELHAVMTGGFATIAGSVLAAYISFGVDPSHLLSASVMSAPAALGIAKLFYPETETSKTSAKDIKIEKGTESNVLHAACEGVVTTIPLVANITANLIAFISFIAFVDAILSWLCVLVYLEADVCSLSNIFGYVFMPLAWVMGVPWEDCYKVGQLLGTKTIINEFIGYRDLTKYINENAISKRAEIIATYALCGFSNIAGIGIQIGALGSMAPERRGDLADIALRAMISGSIACFLTACVAGSLITADISLDIQNSTDIISNSTLL